MLTEGHLVLNQATMTAEKLRQVRQHTDLACHMDRYLSTTYNTAHGQASNNNIQHNTSHHHNKNHTHKA